jgi:hypothetical protein
LKEKARIPARFFLARAKRSAEFNTLAKLQETVSAFDVVRGSARAIPG